MKKFFLIILSFVLVSISILVPVSASSSSSNFDPSYLNSNPTYQVFSVPGSSNLLITPSQYTPYLITYGDYTWLSIFPLCLDSYYRPIAVSDVYFYVYSYSQSDAIYRQRYGNSYFSELESFFYDSSHTFYCDIEFVFNDPSVAYVALIPLSFEPGDNEGLYLEIASYTNSYLRSISGYSLGYADGKRDGIIEGVNSVDKDAIRQDGFDSGYGRGFDDGKEYGISISDPDEMLPAITDATLQVVSSPFQAISNALNFNVFGVNIASLFFILISLLIIGFIIKHFI